MALLPTGGSKTNVRGSYRSGCLYLSRADPILRGLIRQVGPCRLAPRRDYFVTLCDSIISQQLSVTVAEVIFNRFAGLYPSGRPTPVAVSGTPPARLRGVGLSSQKAKYLKDLAGGFMDGRIIPRRFARQSNEAIIQALDSIHGIGRWTAEMFLIFSLNRLDVLPVNDLGIQKAIQRGYRLRALPSPAKIRAIGKPWHPYESLASWYLWQSLRV